MIQSLISITFLALFIFGTKLSFLHASLRMLNDTVWNPALAWGIWCQRMPGLAFGALVIIGWAGWTRKLTRILLLKLDDPLCRPITASVVLCLFSCYCFGLAVNGVLYPWTTALFFLPFIIPGLREIRTWVVEFKIGEINPWLVLLGMVCLVIWAFDFCSPPLIWDAVLDHFRFAELVAWQNLLPLHWTNHTGDMPKFSEIAWAGFWSMGGEFLSKASLVIPTLLTVWLLSAYSKKLGLPGWIGPLLLLTCPYFLALDSGGYAEGTLVLFELILIIACLEWIHEPSGRSWLFTLAFFTGASFATKYTAVLLLPALVLLLIWHKKSGALGRNLGWALVLFILCPIPWYSRDYFANGNPFYPLLTSLFGGPPGFSTEMEKALWADTGRTMGLNYLDYFLRLGRTFFTGQNGVGALWTPLAAMALPWWRGDKAGSRAWFLAFFCAIYFLGWGWFCSNLRHGSGGAIAFILLAMMLWGEAWKEGRKGPKILLGMGLILSTIATMFTQLQTTAPYASALGMEDPLLRLKRNYSFEMTTYDAYRVIEDHSRPQDRVLAFGVFQTYTLRRGSFVDFFWKQPMLLEWADQNSTAHELAVKLKEEGVDYILYQRQEAVQMSQREKGFNLGKMPEAHYVEFWRYYAEPLWVSENCLVYRINTEPAARPYPLLELPGIQEKFIFNAERPKGDKPVVFNPLDQLLKKYPDLKKGKELQRILQSE